MSEDGRNHDGSMIYVFTSRVKDGIVDCPSSNADEVWWYVMWRKMNYNHQTESLSGMEGKWVHIVCIAAWEYCDRLDVVVQCRTRQPAIGISEQVLDGYDTTTIRWAQTRGKYQQWKASNGHLTLFEHYTLSSEVDLKVVAMTIIIIISYQQRSYPPLTLVFTSSLPLFMSIHQPQM